MPRWSDKEKHNGDIREGDDDDNAAGKRGSDDEEVDENKNRYKSARNRAG